MVVRVFGEAGVGMVDFTYHPDPVATGSAAPDDRLCSICGHVAGFRYVGPIYGRTNFEVVCLECIHSGRAASELKVFPEQDLVFAGIDLAHDESWANVPPDVIDEILNRTPGFRGWQEEHWLAHCDDACVFLGPVGGDGLRRAGDDAVEAIRVEMAGYGWSPDQIDGYISGLAVNPRDGFGRAYLFKCRVCGAHQAYSDFD